ncbi:MAG: solute:sodium symporter family transporter [Verrucomicrobiales bacterium]
MLALISFLLFTALVAFLSWRYTRGDGLTTGDGYFLAGRSLPWIVIGGSLLLTNLSTEQLVGLNGGGFRHGMQVAAWEIFAAVAMIAMALIFLPRYLRGGVTTVSQFLAQRYDRTVGTLISVLLLLSLLTNLLPFVLYSGALFMVQVFRIPEAFGVGHDAAVWLTVIALGTVGSIYAIFGGLKAVAISDTLNGAGLFLGGLLIPLLALRRLGEGSILGGFHELGTVRPEMLDPVGGAGDNVPFATLFTGLILLHLYYWCTNQAIVQRTFGARSLEQGQKGLLFAAALKLLGPFYLVLPGIIAWHLFAGQLQDQPDGAYGLLVQEVLPAPLLGLFAAVIFGAILSSFNSGLNSAVTLFSVDLYRGLARPEIEDAALVRGGKIFGLAIAVGAVAIAPFIALAEGGLFDLMKRLAALFNIPLLAITLFGMISPRVPPLAAKLALVSGFVFYAWFGLWQDNVIFGHTFHWLHLAGINFLVIVVLMFVITAWRPLPHAWAPPEGTTRVDLTPWRGAKVSAVAILVAIAAIYAVLSRFG